MGAALASVSALVIAFKLVVPAKAGIQSREGSALPPWIPAFAGMTNWGRVG